MFQPLRARQIARIIASQRADLPLRDYVYQLSGEEEGGRVMHLLRNGLVKTSSLLDAARALDVHPAAFVEPDDEKVGSFAKRAHPETIRAIEIVREALVKTADAELAPAGRVLVLNRLCFSPGDKTAMEIRDRVSRLESPGDNPAAVVEIISDLGLLKERNQ